MHLAKANVSETVESKPNYPVLTQNYEPKKNLIKKIENILFIRNNNVQLYLKMY